jgi:hypothetical protein
MAAACTAGRAGRGSFPASPEAGNSSRDVGLFSEFTKGVM